VRAGQPADIAYVELGPGRGTLAADALRAMAKAGLTPPVHFVETSPVLRTAQEDRVPDATWHDEIASLPDDGPLLIVANEFFDALPIEQYDARGEALSIAAEGDRFIRAGAVAREESAASLAIVANLADRLAAQGGAALIVDYGYAGSSSGDTLQAVSRHAFADPWQAPGARDLTAHVDFGALAAAARTAGVRVCGPVGQGAWLEALGIGARAQALAKAAPERGADIAAARTRLTATDQMGDLFKAMALASPDWPQPAGFPA
jgi:SAM-dependent MidA family methyltransferase